MSTGSMRSRSLPSCLSREAAIQGKPLNITVEKKAYPGWDDFKQAVTLSAEAGNAPDIVVTGHEDIAPWAQAGLIVPSRTRRSRLLAGQRHL